MDCRISLTVSLLVLLALATSGDAATFQTDTGGERTLRCYLTLGTPHPPVAGCTGGAVHPYSGPHLEPGVSAPGVDLASARILGADLQSADFSGARFAYSDLLASNFSGADLSNANLSGASFRSVILDGADFSGANLSGASSLGSVTGTALYNEMTVFGDAWLESATTCLMFNLCTPFDPVAAGWTMVPEPTSSVLLGLGLLILGFLGRPSGS